MWTTTETQITKTFQFKDFNEAFSFMTSVALLSEKKNHHPTWTNTWNKVIISLSTHDAGGIVTDKDHDLANEIDLLYDRY
jgi:4a-hydroxytetrahydrobiopterin dehydratase